MVENRIMRDIVIVGASGFGKEVLQLLNKINEENLYWNILGFIDDNPELLGVTINNYKVIGQIEYLKNISFCYVVIAIADPSLKEMLVEKIKGFGKDFIFPNLIYPNVEVSVDVNQIGVGNILSNGCIFTSNIIIGDFNTFNTRSTLGHDVILGNYNTLNPNVQISGQVIIGSNNFFGANSVVLQGMKIGFNNYIGACSLVIRNIKNGVKVFGIPAQKFKI